MKKILSVMVAIVVLLGIATSNVNAANVVASKTEVNKGDKVVVSINLTEETRNIDVKLTYDSTKFEYVKDSATSTLGSLTVNDKTEGKIIVSASNPSVSTKQVSFTFVAKENTDASEFKATGLVTEKGEEFTSDNISVKVVEKAQEPTTPGEEKPSTGDQKEEPTTPTTDTENKEEKTETTVAQKVDTNGKKITKLPQTGVSIIAIAGIVCVIAIATVVVKRNVK